jgi:hypothetical protein
VVDGDAQVWHEDDAVFVTEIHDTPGHRELHFWLAAGTLDEDMFSLANKVMDWGRDQGCTVATLNGRRGWERTLKRTGWTLRHIELQKVL